MRSTFMLILLATACSTVARQGPAFERWDRWLPTTLLRLCNDYDANFVVVLDGRRRVHLASGKCTSTRLHVGRHFLIPRGLQFSRKRFVHPGWVISVPLTLTEVRFGSRKNLVDLLAVRGEGAEAWPFQQRGPEFEAALPRPRVAGQRHDADPVYRSSGEQVRLAPPPRGKRIIGRPIPGPPARVVSPPWIPPAGKPTNATVIIGSTRPGMVVQRFALSVSGGGLARRRWQRVCELPCRFQLESGRYRLRFDGSGLDPRVIEANLHPGRTDLLVKPGRSIVKHAGGVSIGLGVILAALGGGLAAKGFSHGYGLLGGGLGGIGLGAALVMWSRTTIEVRRTPPRTKPVAPRAPPGRTVSLRLGWRF